MESGKNLAGASVAWFKLAYLITRKEREKALSVYRLLSHSFEDRAYALQLEGDILWALDDQLASEKYKQAAFLYRKEKRWVNAIAVCEHMLALDQANQDLRGIVLDLYVIADWDEKLQQTLHATVQTTKQHALSEDQLFELFKIVIDRANDCDDLTKKNRLVTLVKSFQEHVPSAVWARLQTCLA
ncbi:hypothetical protein K2W90_03415 [Candidatus Babeliales bacterium]|nr:hypothetical protein [Candidatus Babeliales bacterium]